MEKISVKTCVIFLAAVLLLQSMPSVRVDSSAEVLEPSFSSLTEVPAGYIGVYTAEDLDAVRYNPASDYILMNDIDMSAATSAGGIFDHDGFGWEPIGAGPEDAFTGVFDGNGYSIRRIRIVVRQTLLPQYIGIFGYTAGTIRNLRSSDHSITISSSAASTKEYLGLGKIFIGSIAGANAGTIEQCSGSSSFEAVTDYTADIIYDPILVFGGICGINDAGTIQCCFNEGDIGSSDDYVSSGGIAGISHSGIIDRCYNTGRIQGRYSAGIAAHLQAEGCVIRNSYNTGWIGGTKPAGIVSVNGSSNSLISCCYVLYNISLRICDISLVYDQVVTDCYCSYGKDISRTDMSFHSIESMKKQESFRGFDFDAVWEMGTDPSYPFPVLKDIGHKVNPYEDTTDFSGGNGSLINPFRISSGDHLDNVRKYLDAIFVLSNSIRFTPEDFAEGGDYYNGNQGWIAIGSMDYQAFEGIFDGQGFFIEGLEGKATDQGSGYLGTFGINHGIIRNLGIVGDRFLNVSFNNVKAGGVCGENAGEIIRCYHTGTIGTQNPSGCSMYGGIAGKVLNGSIRECFNRGDIAGDPGIDYAGGISAYISNSTISRCFNTGSITGKSAGGIFGRSDTLVTDSCYNAGRVTGVKAGGIGGEVFSLGENAFTACYYADTADAGVSNATGDMTRLGIGEMCDRSSYPGFDFESDWDMAPGYLPYLQSIPLVLSGSLRAAKDPVRLAAGGSLKLSIETDPVNATFHHFSYMISDPGIAAVDPAGSLSGITVGQTEVTVTDLLTMNQIVVQVQVLPPVDSIRISGPAEIPAGGQASFSAEVLPENAASLDVDWSSSNDQIAAVDENGVVTGISGGYVYITATAKDGMECYESVPLTVMRHAESISLSASQTQLPVNGSFTLKATFLPSDTTDKTLFWTSSDETVAIVNSSGTVKGLSKGSASITATTRDGGFTATCAVSVYQAASSIRFSRDELFIGIGCVQYLTVVVTPEDATNYHYSTSFYGSGYLNLSAASLLGYEAGSGLARLYSESGALLDSCYIQVGNPVTSIKLDASTMSIKEGQSGDLHVSQVLPSNAITKKVDWYSSNKTIATVSAEGKVTGVSPGTAKIYAKAIDGSNISASCSVTVNALPMCVVTFNSMGGSAVPAVTVKEGSLAPMPGKPVRAGYTFIGWYTSPTYGETWDFESDAVTRYVTIYAKWDLTDPVDITSSVYSVDPSDGYISNIAIETTTLVFLGKFAEAGFMKVFSGSSEIPAGDFIGTGMTVKLISGSIEKMSLKAIVTGDLNGDGKVTLTDYVMMKSHLIGKKILSGAYAGASDINGDSRITLTDFIMLKAHIIRKKMITPVWY